MLICCGMPPASSWQKDGPDPRALQAYLGHRNFQNTTRDPLLSSISTFVSSLQTALFVRRSG